MLAIKEQVMALLIFAPTNQNYSRAFRCPDNTVRGSRLFIFKLAVNIFIRKMPRGLPENRLEKLVLPGC